MNFGPMKPRNQCENVLLVELTRCSQRLVSRESNHGEGFALAFEIGSGDMLAQKFLKTEIHYAQRCMFIHFCPCFSSPDMKNFSITPSLFLFGDAGGVGGKLSAPVNCASTPGASHNRTLTVLTRGGQGSLQCNVGAVASWAQ